MLTAVGQPPSTVTDPRRYLDDLLTHVVAVGASDLHLAVGIAPCLRLDGRIIPIADTGPLDDESLNAMLRSVLTGEQWDRFVIAKELDLSYSIRGVSRYRANIFRQQGSFGAAFRVIPHQIRRIAELGLPDVVEGFAQLPRGLVLITGPTGSGKTTTLAGLIDAANRTRATHIITIEDPIEYKHTHINSIVNQREVGPDTDGFAIALRGALRQDPDIIMVGELRDLETTATAITAAETGHLVLATLHTRSASQTVERLIDIFPGIQQEQVRTQLASCLQGVVTQALVPRKNGIGRTVACEVMVATPAIRNLIRDGKVHQIPTFLQSSADAGMMSFDQHLAHLYAQELINKATALDVAHDPAEFKRLARVA